MSPLLVTKKSKEISKFRHTVTVCIISLHLHCIRYFFSEGVSLRLALQPITESLMSWLKLFQQKMTIGHLGSSSHENECHICSYFPLLKPKMRRYFKCFTDFAFGLIYAFDDISEHSSGLSGSPLALCSPQSFNSLNMFGAVRWYTMTRVFVNVCRYSPFISLCFSSLFASLWCSSLKGYFLLPWPHNYLAFCICLHV